MKYPLFDQKVFSAKKLIQSKVDLIEIRNWFKYAKQREIINRLFNLLIFCLKECFKIIIKELKYLITV
jgi:hypothetical protein